MPHYQHSYKDLFQYNRLPFGVKTAPAIFQNNIEKVLAGVEGAIPYIDDILIHASDKNTLIKRVEAVLNRLQEFNFNPKMLVFR